MSYSLDSCLQFQSLPLKIHQSSLPFRNSFIAKLWVFYMGLLNCELAQKVKAFWFRHLLIFLLLMSLDHFQSEKRTRGLDMSVSVCITLHFNSNQPDLARSDIPAHFHDSNCLITQNLWSSDCCGEVCFGSCATSVFTLTTETSLGFPDRCPNPRVA